MLTPCFFVPNPPLHQSYPTISLIQYYSGRQLPSPSVCWGSFGRYNYSWVANNVAGLICKGSFSVLVSLSPMALCPRSIWRFCPIYTIHGS